MSVQHLIDVAANDKHPHARNARAYLDQLKKVAAEPGFAAEIAKIAGWTKSDPHAAATAKVALSDDPKREAEANLARLTCAEIVLQTRMHPEVHRL